MTEDGQRLDTGNSPKPIPFTHISCHSSASGGHRGSWKVTKIVVVKYTYTPPGSPQNYPILRFTSEDKKSQIII